MSGEATTTVRVRFEGRVQGVGFRAWTRRRAAGLGLSGWVRNRLDGSVEAVLSGSPEQVEVMLAACARGPSSAGVQRVSVSPDEAPAKPGFDQLPTA